MKVPKQIRKKLYWGRRLIPAVLVLTWLAFAGIGGPYFGKISDVSSTDLTTFLPANADSTKVNNALEDFRDSKNIPLLVVFENDGKKLTSENKKALDKLDEKLQKVDGVIDTVSPAIISDNKKAAFMVVPVESASEFDQVFEAARVAVDSAETGLQYKLTGPASLANDLRGAFAGIDGTLLVVALSVVFIILLVVYRSPLLPIIVLVTSMSALAVAIFVVYYLAQNGIVELNGQVQGILFILVIGAATDYSLLYIARYREELTHHVSTAGAAWAALKASFEPIVAAGGTVTAGLLCLLLSELGSNKALGPVGGVGIGLSILAALTLLPSLLLAFGRIAFWPRIPRFNRQTDEYDYKKNHPIWAKVGRLVGRHPRRTWVASALVLLVACVGVLQLKATGVSQSQLILGRSEARDGQAVLDKHFASGSGAPMYALVNQADARQVTQVLDSDTGVDSVSMLATGKTGSKPVGTAEQELKAEILKEVTKKRNAQLKKLRAAIEKQLEGAPSMMVDAAYDQAVKNIPTAEEIAAKAYPFKNAREKVVNEKVILQATLTDAADTFAARDTLVRLRGAVKTVDVTALVGGTTAVQYDTNEAAMRDEKVIIPVILLAITVILALLLRAIVAPIVLLLTTVVSFGATLGISAWLFNHVWQFPGADPSVIIFGFVFLVALGIDYNIFLMTRVREETMRFDVRRGTLKGLVVTGGVITSAGVVLAATFAALGVIPILFLVQMAFIVAFGVLLDTLIVRSLLVPALTLEIGRLMWWPSKLWRRKK